MALSKKRKTKMFLQGSIAILYLATCCRSRVILFVETVTISSLLFLAACADDSSSSGPNDNGLSSSSSIIYELNSSAFIQPEVVAVKNKSISGVSQKGPFVTGSAVKLYELDGESYAQTGNRFTGKITSDDGKFSVSNVTLASQYALLEVNGYYRNEISGKKSIGTMTPSCQAIFFAT